MSVSGDKFVKELESALNMIREKMKSDLQAVRSNRPSPELLEGLKVNYYDQTLTIRELGSLSIRPPREIIIKVWDTGAVPAIQKAIEAAKLGLTVQRDGESVRVFLPALTDERREELIRLVRRIAEDHRIQVRGQRDDILKKAKRALEDKEISEDESFKTKDKVQKLIDETNREIESAVEAKSKDIAG